MQVSSIVPKTVSAPLGDGERNFVQSTSPEQTAVKIPVQRTAPNANAEKADDAKVSLKTASVEQIDKALDKVNEAFAQKNQNLLATIEKDQETGINVFKVTDKVTKELVRQFPAEAVIAMAEVINQSLDAKGQLIHVKA